MEVLVDGSRANADVWLESLKASSALLPLLSPEEQHVAASLSLSNEDYARSKYAIEKTRTFLQARSVRLGELVEDLLRVNEPAFSVGRVWLNTYRGLYRIDISKASRDFVVNIPEEIADALLDGGSAEAQRRVETLLAEHLISTPVAWAS